MESQVAAHLSDPPPKPSTIRQDIPSGFDDVIAKGMAKDPDQRYQDVREFAAAMRAAKTNAATDEGAWSAPTELWSSQQHPSATAEKQRATKRIVWAGVAVAVVIVVGVAIALSGNLRSGQSELPQQSPQTTANKTQPSTSAAASLPPSKGDEPGPTAAGASSSQGIEVSFTQIKNSLNVRLRNSNPDVGLIRSPFELALIDEAGAVISTVGQEGFPGAPINTIYQLPPSGEFGMNLAAVPTGRTVSSVELTVLGEWVQWDTVDAPKVTLTNQTLQPDSGSTYSGPSVTGRLSIDKEGPLNVVVIAFVKTSAGTVVSDVYVDCVQKDQDRTFETTNSDDARGPYELENLVAYTTAIRGAGPQSFPTDC
jgi:hypothetical protein